jgi:hypothetical protein
VSLYGVVININAFGATVRLDGGDLARANADDVDAHRAQYEHALVSRARLAFLRGEGAGRPAVTLAPQISDERLDEQIASYLRSTQEAWESAEVPAHQRHFLRKKKRAAQWDVKNGA